MTDGYTGAVVEPPTNTQYSEQSRLYNITHTSRVQEVACYTSIVSSTDPNEVPVSL